jgi:uncharacterized protein
MIIQRKVSTWKFLIAGATLASITCGSTFGQRIPSVIMIPIQCHKPLKTDTERTICGNPDLIELDGELARLLSLLANLVDKPWAIALINNQNAWLQGVRDPCGWNAGCIRRAYQARVQQINDAMQGN